jgi:hypothetical protein
MKMPDPVDDHAATVPGRFVAASGEVVSVEQTMGEASGGKVPPMVLAFTLTVRAMATGGQSPLVTVHVRVTVEPPEAVDDR